VYLTKFVYSLLATNSLQQIAEVANFKCPTI